MKRYEEKLLHKLKMYRKISFYIAGHEWTVRINETCMKRTDLSLRNDKGEFLYFYVDWLDQEKETVKKIIIERIKESRKWKKYLKML